MPDFASQNLQITIAFIFRVRSIIPSTKIFVFLDQFLIFSAIQFIRGILSIESMIPNTNNSG